jgi:hypothetical protein
MLFVGMLDFFGTKTVSLAEFYTDFPFLPKYWRTRYEHKYTFLSSQNGWRDIIYRIVINVRMTKLLLSPVSVHVYVSL